jgi:HisA/HisF family protein
MLLIPVIDLMQGQVVRAVRGQRSAYHPIASTLCSGSEPLRIARVLCGHCKAAQLYVADLDALLGRVPQATALAAILESLPEVELWLDAGFADAAAAQSLLRELPAAAVQRVRPVFASESLRSAAALSECFRHDRKSLLSLDRRDGQHLDAAGCWQRPQDWPERVIVMTLERVGADSGPDLETLREVQASAPHARLIGAGGIRDAADLARAREAGAHAWLVASALHDGRIGRLPAVEGEGAASTMAVSAS